MASLAVLVLAPEADATEQRWPAAYELTWEAPPSCPEAEELRERIAALAPNAAGGDGLMHVAATVVQLSDRFSVRIATDFAGRHDERSAESETCGDLVDATALVVAVALEPGAEAPRVSKSPTPIIPRPRIPEPEPPNSSDQLEVTGARTSKVVEPDRGASDSPSVTPQPFRLSPPDAILVRIAPLVEFGSLPSVDAGTALTAGVRWAHWRAEVFGLYLFPQRQTFDRTRSVLQLGAAGARVCHRLLSGRVEFPTCLGLEAGALRAQTQGQRPRTTLSLPWLAPSVRGGVAVGGEHVGFFAAGEVAVSVLVPRILVGDESAFRTRAVSLRALAGVEFFLPIDRR